MKRYGAGEVSQFNSAEMIAEKWDCSRDEMEAFAVESHERAIRARAEGRFEGEIAPLEGVEHDEGPREPNWEKIRSLPTLKEGGRVTAAVASQISDAAAALLIVNEQGLKDHGLTPRARIHHLSVRADDPIWMLTAPIPATRHAFEKTGMSMDDIDLVEINEAFASVVLAWEKELDVDHAKVNVNGGAIALGHPLGATGARLMTTLLNELERTGGRYGLQTMCEGGGQANVTIIERLWLMAFTRDEIEAAFQRYQDAANEAGRTGDWQPWVDCFVPDVEYVEHLYGDFKGRDAVQEWIEKTMNAWPFTHMQIFPWDWYTIDAEQGWVVGQVENRFVDPGDGKVYEGANWTRLVYAGDGLSIRGGRVQPRRLRARGEGLARRVGGAPPRPAQGQRALAPVVQRRAVRRALERSARPAREAPLDRDRGDRPSTAVRGTARSAPSRPGSGRPSPAGRPSAGARSWVAPLPGRVGVLAPTCGRSCHGRVAPRLSTAMIVSSR